MHKRVRKSDKRSRLRRIGINTIVFMLLAMSYGCQSGEGQSEGVKPPEINQLSSRDRVYKLNHDSLSRQYLLHVPPSYINGHPIPLVINLHGGGANARMQRYSSQMNVKADQAGFMVAYPEGTGRVLLGRVFGTFNAGRCCGPAMKQNIDDVEFVRRMIDDIADRYSVDTRRVYSTGHSNGSLMSYRLACELSDRIAAIAPNAAHDAFDDCRPSRSVPVIHFHGTLDPAAMFGGGHCGGNTKDPGWSAQ